jgi:hypothetical protein
MIALVVSLSPLAETDVESGRVRIVSGGGGVNCERQYARG